MRYNAKVRYTDSKGRSHYVDVESDVSDRDYIASLVRERYPAEDVYFQAVHAA